MPKLNRKKVHPRGVLKEFPPTHVFSDGLGGLWTHEGTGAECRKPDCVAWRAEQAAERPWGYSDEHVESWTIGSELDYTAGEEPEDPRPDPLAPCPLTGRPHRWRWADDGNGHSGDVCACGAFEE